MIPSTKHRAAQISIPSRKISWNAICQIRRNELSTHTLVTWYDVKGIGDSGTNRHIKVDNIFSSPHEFFPLGYDFTRVPHLIISPVYLSILWRSISKPLNHKSCASTSHNASIHSSATMSGLPLRVGAGLVFGAALTASEVYLPSVIVSQMELKDYHMLNVFLSASANSAYVMLPCTFAFKTIHKLNAALTTS